MEASDGVVKFIYPGLQSFSRPAASVFRNLSFAEIRVHEEKCKEAQFAANGAVVVTTGIYTGRSPKDRYWVRSEPSQKLIDWGAVNKPIDRSVFTEVQRQVAAHLGTVDTLYVFEGFAGRGRNHRTVRVITESCVQHHFCKNMFVTEDQLLPDEEAPDTTDKSRDITVLVASKHQVENWESLPGLRSSTCIAFDLERRLGVISGSEYSGEIKKGIFSLLNYECPLEGKLSMHCSAVQVTGPKSAVAIFFGLSGTGKTSLSSAPAFEMVGDDEIVWTDDGIMNIEGGCYAKVIDIDPTAEKVIFDAIRENTILENVVVSPDTREPDYHDRSITENTRASIPIEHYSGFVKGGVAGHPTAIIFLTCDAFGVLPSVSYLSEEQAMYMFISGYSSKVAGTELGITEPKPVFSPMFGGAFMPQFPKVYADLLDKKVQERGGVPIYLVNTGWKGGGVGVGARYKIAVSRAIVAAAVSGELATAAYQEPDPIFGLRVPIHVSGLTDDNLHARDAWADKAEYDRVANQVASMFVENWSRRNLSSDLAAFGPQPLSK